MLFRKLRNISLNHIYCRWLTSNLEVLEEMQTKPEPTIIEIERALLTKTKTNLKRHYLPDIDEFFNSKPGLSELKDVIPAKFILKKYNKVKNIPRLILVDKDVARDISKVLQPHLQPFGGHVMEINAGAGILTEELLKTKLQNLRIYEPDSSLCNHLLKMVKFYQSDARLFMTNLLTLGHIMKRDKEDNGDRVTSLFNGLPSSKWEDEPVVKVIGALSDERFIFHIMFSTVLQDGLCRYGRPEMFLIIRPELYEKLKSNPDDMGLYKSNSVIFQVLFNHEELTKVPEKVFLPWVRKSKSKREEKQNEEISDHLCLVRISPKKDLLQTFSPDSLRWIWFFIKFLMRKKSSLLIEVMEKWAPGIGVRLISKGHTIFTECGFLTPEDYVEIYLELITWPGFHSSSFHTWVEDLLGKVLQYSITEEELSDEKFNKFFSKEELSNEDDNVFDEDAPLKSKNENNIVDRGR